MSRSRRFLLIVGATVAALVATLAVAVVWSPFASDEPAELTRFLTRDGDRLMLDGRPFAAAGSNNYRPGFIDQPLVDQIMQAAAENHFQVMRVWGFNDIGLADGTDSVDPQNATTYYHYWGGEKPVYNDGPNGLQRLDYVVASAKRHDIRLVLPLVNNWASFGGMDQYVRWADAPYHSDFYTNETIRGWYRDWVEHLLDRTNIYTGVKYKHEPTIAVWELANEPRCAAAGQYPPGPDCDTRTITGWATDMAAYVKSIDPWHLLGLGDEGFMCEPGADHFAYDCSQGVDARAIATIADIDLIGMHLYPDHWGTDVSWSTDYINRHVQLADEIGKPLFMGEYGWRGPAPRTTVFHEWLTAFQDGGGDIALYWQMQVRDEHMTPADTDGFTAYCPSAVCTQVSYRSLAMSTGRQDFPPVAELDVLVMDSAAPQSLDLLANDISLFSELDPATVDLGPESTGVQSSQKLPEGSLEVSDGTVTFTPVTGFEGVVEFPYVVSDVDGRPSDITTAIIRVT